MNSDGNFKQGEWGPSLRLCMTYDGCEGREGDNVANPKKALSKLGLIRNDGNCPPSMPKSDRVWQKGGGCDGDLNQDMNSGGTVRMCEQNEVSAF